MQKSSSATQFSFGAPCESAQNCTGRNGSLGRCYCNSIETKATEDTEFTEIRLSHCRTSITLCDLGVLGGYAIEKSALVPQFVVRLVHVLRLAFGGFPIPRLAVEAVGTQAANVT